MRNVHNLRMDTKVMKKLNKEKKMLKMETNDNVPDNPELEQYYSTEIYHDLSTKFGTQFVD